MLPTMAENSSEAVIGMRNGIFGVTHILSCRRPPAG